MARPSDLVRRKLEEALSESDNAIRLNPNEPDFRFKKGDALIKLQRYDEAVKEFDIAIGLNRKEPRYHRYKGLALRDLSKFDEAIRENDDAILLNRNEPAYHSDRAFALFDVTGRIPTVILVNRKGELGKKIIEESEVAAKAKAYDASYFYTSTETGENVETALQTLAERIVTDRLREKGPILRPNAP